jgi:hypothetical protein
VALYRRIGDIVSYSYTLWSMGKTHMMLGRLALSERYTKEALRNFRRTKDPRGVIYCRLSEAEIAFLRGREASARKLLQAAGEDARSWGFAVERCHCRMLLGEMEDARGGACYRQLGLRLSFGSIPFNIP